jgi:hypothetical protein
VQGQQVLGVEAESLRAHALERLLKVPKVRGRHPLGGAEDRRPHLDDALRHLRRGTGYGASDEIEHLDPPEPSSGGDREPGYHGEGMRLGTEVVRIRQVHIDRIDPLELVDLGLVAARGGDRREREPLDGVETLVEVSHLCPLLHVAPSFARGRP